jgi:ammonium transporter Rh
MCLIHEVGYSLNEVICYNLINGFDVGGSTVIHVFGAYGGLTLSLFLTSVTRPNTKPLTNYTSNIFAFIGTLFLWMYWPSFNFGIAGVTPFTKTQIISNTILALTGSCLATFMASAFIKNRFTMEHLLNATLSGGVVIGAAAGIMFNPGGALAIGFLTGIVSTCGFQYLTPYL